MTAGCDATPPKRRRLPKPRKTSGAVVADILASLPEERRDDPIVLRVARDLGDLEELKVLHEKDIGERGVTELVENGNQKFWRANPSVGALLKVIAEQRRLRAELKARGMVWEPDADDADADAEKEIASYLEGEHRDG